MRTSRGRRRFIGALAAAGTSGLAGVSPWRRARAGPRPVAPADPASEVFDVRRFGAVGDGATPATAAIQKAIDACGKAGGMVLVPPGRFLCGALFLRSNVHLHLSSGALLLASQHFDDYPPIQGRWEGIERKTYSSLLTGIARIARTTAPATDPRGGGAGAGPVPGRRGGRRPTPPPRRSARS